MTDATPSALPERRTVLVLEDGFDILRDILDELLDEAPDDDTRDALETQRVTVEALRTVARQQIGPDGREIDLALRCL